MHELSIALSILDIAAEESDRRGGAAILAIHITLGQLSGVVKGALLSAYEIARESSAFCQTALVIEEVPIVVYCPACQVDQPVESMQNMCCRACGTISREIVRGNELQVTAMEIAEAAL